MRVVVTLDARYLRTPDGAVWTREGPAYRFWTRYLHAFDSVRVVARVEDVAAVTEGAHRVDGEAVELWPLPYYVGPAQYLWQRRALGRALRTAAGAGDAVILRVPSPIGSLLAAARQRQGLPYALEVVADPYDVYAPGVIRHPTRPWVRYRSTARLRHECRHAVGVSYVTDRTLQARYPSAPGAPTANCSSVDLPEEAYRSGPRERDDFAHPTTLVSIGSLKQPYKGIDTLLHALAQLARDGLPLRLVHLGDGEYRPALELLARRLDLAGQVTFAGWLPAGPAVRRQLDAADLFVLPSRTEGLPRALIEAMARALPAVGTTVGGIPELLPAADLVPPDSPVTLARAIRALVADPGRMAAASARNLERARDFAAERLTPRREAYYRAVAAEQAARVARTDRRPDPARSTAA